MATATPIISPWISVFNGLPLTFLPLGCTFRSSTETTHTTKPVCHVFRVALIGFLISYGLDFVTLLRHDLPARHTPQIVTPNASLMLVCVLQASQNEALPGFFWTLILAYNLMEFMIRDPATQSWSSTYLRYFCLAIVCLKSGVRQACTGRSSIGKMTFNDTALGKGIFVVKIIWHLVRRRLSYSNLVQLCTCVALSAAHGLYMPFMRKLITAEGALNPDNSDISYLNVLQYSDYFFTIYIDYRWNSCLGSIKPILDETIIDHIIYSRPRTYRSSQQEFNSNLIDSKNEIIQSIDSLRRFLSDGTIPLFGIILYALYEFNHAKAWVFTALHCITLLQSPFETSKIDGINYVQLAAKLKSDVLSDVENVYEILQCGRLDDMSKRQSRDVAALQEADKNIYTARFYFQWGKLMENINMTCVAIFLSNSKYLGSRSRSPSAEYQQFQQVSIPRMKAQNAEEILAPEESLRHLSEPYKSWGDDRPGAMDLAIDDKGMIKLINVDLQYGSGLEVFNQVNLSLPMGQLIAIMGHNGSGKTSLIELISGRRRPTRGAIYICDQNLQDVKQLSLYKEIWLSEASKPEFGRISILDHIRFAQPGASAKEVQEICEKLDVHHAITQHVDGYNATYEQKNLSTGTIEKLACARALLANHRIFLWDEAMANVDTNGRQRFMAQLKSGQLKGRTNLFITQRPSEAQRADYVVYLNGKTIEQGPPEELMAMDSCFKRDMCAEYPQLRHS